MIDTPSETIENRSVISHPYVIPEFAPAASLGPLLKSNAGKWASGALSPPRRAPWPYPDPGA
jgi:hypothetical protein